jgi:hypothetical protein
VAEAEMLAAFLGKVEAQYGSASAEEGVPLLKQIEELTSRLKEERYSVSLRDAALKLIRSLPPRVWRRSGTLRFVELFSGCGGRSTGYHLDSHQWEGESVESDGKCCMVHRANQLGTVHKHRITVENPLPSGLEPVADTLTAGAPCVGYSVAGLQRGEEDPRDGIPAMLEAIKSVMPLTLELENVSNLQRHESVLENIVSTLKGLGYFVRVVGGGAWGRHRHRCWRGVGSSL